MHFKRIRLSGFKSFVEPTELTIEPGLTGVVGPNGCGKSNLLEALRWVMGESSYKRMRASGMDDVIFSGSATRPARNMAEVMVTLENSERTAPAAFNDTDTLEIARRIEREAGSAYRINSKDVRAKDVQLLFADASTGARSPALVRQGQIGEIVNSKPQARRRILEEAAGITGLYTRRHEAELRLNAAETNLTRLEDVVGQLEIQLASLKRQARQASRYKNISSDIRKAEAAQHYVDWHETSTTLEAEQTALREAERTLGEATRAAAEASRGQAEVSEELPPLREQEAVRGAVLQRLTVERENLDAEEQRAQARQDELKTRLAQIDQDIAREQEMSGDAQGAIGRLAAEEHELGDAGHADAGARTSAEEAVTQARGALEETETSADAIAAKLSEQTAHRNALANRQRELEQRLESLTTALEHAKAEQSTLQAKRSESAGVAEATAALEGAQERGEAAQGAVEQAEADLETVRDAEAVARQLLEGLRRKAGELDTEVRTLEKLLSVNDGDLWPPLVDAVSVQEGYEVALGAALGDDLDVPADEAAPVHWRTLPPYDENHPLPAGVKSLADVTKAPPALTRRLRQVGIVEPSDGAALQHALQPGQRLVSTQGDLWRWDGYSAGADAPTAAAQRLAERNRLVGLRQEAEQANRATAEAEAAFENANGAMRTAGEQVAERRKASRDAMTAMSEARARLSREEKSESETTSRLAVLEETCTRLAGDIEQAAAANRAAGEELSSLGEDAPLAASLEAARVNVTEHRAAYTEAKAHCDGIVREAQVRAQRLQAITTEKQAWSERAERAAAQVETLRERRTETDQALAAIAGLPQQWQERRTKLFASLEQAETERKAAADALAEAETRLAERDTRAKAAERTLGECRETHVRIEERVAAARERLDDITHRMNERLECGPEAARELAGIAPEADLPEREAVEKRLVRLRAERERLGGVNLRADEEAREVGEQLDGLVNEREDLVQAIHRLRQGISSLNKEGRERLVAAFEKVNASFETLFTALFGGGKAELEFVESDDPLEAGLEIVARPPGKRTQVLSLLSGGEQALTALALIFAVFLTNPSPICVLDECDAPLDDANVERFCNMLDEMLKRTETRFLIITHHAYTMSRMNRLFGVTMSEKGVSQLVSVDLETAERFRETG